MDTRKSMQKEMKVPFGCIIGKQEMVFSFYLKKERNYMDRGKNANCLKEKFCVGDEVYDISAPETRAVITRCKGRDLYVVFCDGSCGKEDSHLFQKTGRHFNLQRILRKLR